MTPLANRARGEAVAALGGRPRRLCLTLGALAQMEAAFEVEGWAALSARLKILSAGDLIVVLSALLEGGGEDVGDVAALDFREAAAAVAAAFEATG